MRRLTNRETEFVSGGQEPPVTLTNVTQYEHDGTIYSVQTFHYSGGFVKGVLALTGKDALAESKQIMANPLANVEIPTDSEAEQEGVDAAPFLQAIVEYEMPIIATVSVGPILPNDPSNPPDTQKSIE